MSNVLNILFLKIISHLIPTEGLCFMDNHYTNERGDGVGNIF